jgi:Uma2 family endonuclease
MTAVQFFSYPEHDRYELVRGNLRVSEPPGGVHGQVAVRLASRLHLHVEAAALGTVLVEAGFILRRGPDTVRGPDISFVSGQQVDPGRVPSTFLPFAPDLAIEILSPEDRPATIDEKVADYLEAGTRLVWVLDPKARSLVIHRPDGAVEVVTEPGVLDGEEVVPGFGAGLTEIFGPRTA